MLWCGMCDRMQHSHLLVVLDVAYGCPKVDDSPRCVHLPRLGNSRFTFLGIPWVELQASRWCSIEVHP